ncbi:unnamed protein product [Acanthoscelides obtectus]|uniref:SCP domain-containing protein n=1 Tax=Acanthoscelides obtectus TaxID=200917 RepID=A0A9P0K4F9_ACAOB|nr:unnamed protein product [Acanthoscelides obtectus]CAK1620273.1 hypothetical protein AOBTE_LOCUS273 [Acanthoscelides obtectus]
MDLYVVLIFLLLEISLVFAGCEDEWPSCHKGRNTVCERNEECGALGNCETGPMNPETRKKLVDTHNILRNQMAGGDPKMSSIKAANMRVLSYDTGLQHTAACHINRCKFEHDKCRGTKKFKTAGQNLYMSTARSSGQKLAFSDPQKFAQNGVESWYSEIEIANPADIADTYKFVPGTGHWTQMIWAETTHIGCAIVEQFNGEEAYLACNYGPAGNIVGARLLIQGETCSRCPLGVFCSQEYPNLCGEVEGLAYFAGGKRTIDRPFLGLVVVLFKCVLYMLFV